MRGRAPSRALIIGGSLAGLFAANLLRRIGWKVMVCERSASDLAGRGAAISSHDALTPILHGIGIAFDHSNAIETSANICIDKRGRITHRLQIAPPRLATAWGRLYRPLKHALPPDCYRPGLQLVRVEPAPAGVAAVFGDGTRIEADLLVAADGTQSTVRGQFLPDAQPRYAGYVCWRFVVPECDLDPEFRIAIAPDFSFFLAEGQMLHGFLIPGLDDEASAGQRAYCVVWYRRADAEMDLPRLLSDGRGRAYGISTPPSVIRLEVIDEARRAAARCLPAEFARIMARAKQPLLQAIVDLESPRLAFDRVALLGDAAFTARPHVAAGVLKAALDAECLARSIAAYPDDPDAALRHYDSARRRVGQAIVARGRYLGAHLEAPTAFPKGSTGARLGRDPEALMSDYGRSNLGDTELV
ncbi:MAG TPA: FAD-dependent monooxygenase [Stellaceae bacterium]|jgi:2-polyprenyl-6-methoxyphenol hydroxylase-like FAD-dependent oxidoreductase|nr:FAD-dependent monooxygenase [Stellaceae bacterium]